VEVTKFARALAVAPLLAALFSAAPARAADAVTYEITSDQLAEVSSLQYIDRSGRVDLGPTPLPWRMDVTLEDADTSVLKGGAEVRTEWLFPLRARWKYVVVSIYSNGTLLCRSTVNIGNATCYGNIPHFS
jgi:hypothetical protein